MKIHMKHGCHSLTDMKCLKKNKKVLMKRKTGGTHVGLSKQEKILIYGSMNYII